MGKRNKKRDHPPKNELGGEGSGISPNYLRQITSDPYLLLMIAIVLIGAYLRLHNLGAQSIWLDEASTYYMAYGESISGVWAHALADRHPPLHFLIINFVSTFSSSEFALRLPSAIFGILTIPMIYKTGEAIFGRKEGLVSAFILSISTIHIFYSQEARMYAQMILFALVSLYFIYMASKENKNWQWIGFVASAALGFYSFYYTIFVLIPELMFYCIIQLKGSFQARRLVLSDTRNIRSFLVSMLAFVLVVSPVLLPFIRQSISRAAGAPTWGMGQSLDFFNTILMQYSTYSNTSYILASIFCAGFVVSILKRDEREKAVLMALMVFVPLVVSYILAARMPFSPRYLLFILPIYILMISRGVTGISQLLQPGTSKKGNIDKNRSLIILVLVILVGALCLSPLASYYTTPQKNDWRGVSSYLHEMTQPGDVVVSLPGYMTQPLEFYYDYSGTYKESASSAARLENISATYDNVNIWYVVTWDITAANPEGDALNWLEQNAQFTSQITGVYIATDRKE
ncbi:MAG: glycosyltransferase family 39 protein [Euryarchaeota archaeon]|nr:glycosyltransferase family 39 protein [Euryarchaeota archaeon]